MTTESSTPLVERIRYSFAARHVQLLARQVISPGFVRLTLGGPQLAGFASAGFDDHVKIVLPQPGQDKPNLPGLVDGGLHIDGERPIMRDYTPLLFDAAANTLLMEFALHEAGPATRWAMHAPIGEWVGIAGPRGSMVIRADLDWHVLLGDETAMPAIERRLGELPAGSRAIVRVQLADPANARVWTSCVALVCAFVPSLAEAVDTLTLPPGDGFVWGAGESTLMTALRAPLVAKGANPKRMRLAAYWKRGVADHGECLTQP